MTMFHADYRFLGAVTFDVNAMDYLGQREELANRAWNTVDICRRHNFYCEILTFPGWSDANDMLDFGWMHARYPLGGYTTLCFRLNGSPIADSLQLLVEPLLSRDVIDFSMVRAAMPQDVVSTVKEDCLEVHLERETAVRLVHAFRGSFFGNCLDAVYKQAKFRDGFALYTDAYEATTTHRSGVDDVAFRLWLSVMLYPEHPIAFDVFR